MGGDAPKGRSYLECRNAAWGIIRDRKSPALKPRSGNGFGSKIVDIPKKTIKVAENPKKAQERKARVPRAKVSGDVSRTRP